MSGNRANASAVNRRTVTQVNPVQNNNMNRGFVNQQQNAGPRANVTSSQGIRNNNNIKQNVTNQKPKLSVSDAIALITLRLGAVETFINSMPPLDQINSFSNNEGNTDENMRVVDEAVFQSIVTRLEKMEQTNKISVPQSPAIDMTVFENKFKVLNDEVNQIKNLLLSVQSFSIQTNQKILDIENKYKTLIETKSNSDNDNENIENVENYINDDISRINGSDNVEHIDLKKIIENELNSVNL
jgi:hypothetical protein